MLSYSVKLSGDNIKKDEVVWGEKYLSPDLSFVTGVTSQDYHLEKINQIEASINSKSDVLFIQSENVTREGYVVVKGKKYPITNNTVFINGKYYYVNNNNVIIDNWLVEKHTIGKEYDNETGAYTKTYYIPSVESKTITASTSGNYVLIDTIYWIENGKVTIDDNEYFFDKNEVGGGCLKYFKDGVCLTPQEITDCTDIKFVVIDKASDYINVTKFLLTKSDDREIKINNVSFISHSTFIKYDDEYYAIEINNGMYVCNIGNGQYPLRTEGDVVLTTSNVTDYENLSELGPYIKLGEGCTIYADTIVQDANNGRKIGLYLSDTYDNINPGDIITAKKNQSFEQVINVEYIDNRPFILYDGTRYEIYSDMLNTVLINGTEYDIESCDGTNCYVYVDGETIPMRKEGDRLHRYGFTISGDSAVTMSYPVIHYSGVTISGIDYRVKEDEFSNFILLETGNVYRLKVIETIGNSLVVCEPDLDPLEFSDSYTKDKVYAICSELVSDDISYQYYIKNPLFGEREVLPGNGKIYSSDATSTDDYQNVLESLKLYTNIGYILLPINLEAGAETNILLDDTREKDFVEAETEKAINPIVDMERDMYVPKYIYNDTNSFTSYTATSSSIDYRRTSMYCSDMTNNDKKRTYIGSFTDFKPIREIQFNFHFRTRDSVSWKVNEGYNNVETSGKTDNWFITDYEPYRTIIDKNSGNTLMDVSDTLGLLYYNNMDVFYQKKSLEKSFARLSYYDDINPQTQSLLHTSTVFINEHNLFKKFIDNSRKNINDYMMIQEPKLEEHEETTSDNEDEKHPSITTKISVSTEYIGKHTPKKIKPEEGGYKFEDAKVNDEDKRLSSRLSIVNKYETDTSSEGFYLYIFKQYAENLHAKPIYMKVDFNHAKIGKTIPFVIPMKWGVKNGDNSYVYPIKKLTIGDDLDEMKAGIPLSYLYGQLYIPMYAMYDFKNKEYAYVFDDRYVEVTDDGIAKINLFEVKIKNDELNSGTTATAVIDINCKQISVQ